MRILFLESSLIWIYGLPSGFIDNGHKVMISGPLSEKNIPIMIEEFKPDFIITIGWGVENTISKQKWIYKYVHEYKIPLIYWAVEDPAFIDDWSLKLIKNIKPSFTFTISEDSLEYYKKNGIKASYMDFGYHPSIHCPVEKNLKYSCSIAVIANAYPDVLDKLPEHFRLKSLETLIVPLLKENIRVDFWGRNWDKMEKYLGVDIPKAWIHGYIPYKNANSIYNSADIVIGLQNYESQVTQRTYEVLASGGLLLTNNTLGVSNLFKSGQDLITSSSPNETIEMVKYYLNNPKERELIRKQGRLAVEKHSYSQRANEMLKVLLNEGILQGEISESTKKGEIYYYENYTEDKYNLYIISPGDTLCGISKRFKVPLNKIMKLNNLLSDEIFVDQVLKISEKIDTSTYMSIISNELDINNSLGNTDATRWIKDIIQASKKHKIPSNILYSMMIAESGGNPNVVSKTGGIGLMQFQVEVANWLGVNPCDPIESIDGAAYYLKQLYNEFEDWKLAVAAYNAGPTTVRKYNGIPPLDEPQNYVKKVFSLSKALNFKEE